MVRLLQEVAKMGRDMDNLYEWRKKNIKRIGLDFNMSTDKDIIDHLDKCANKKEYISKLIREDIKREVD